MYESFGVIFSLALAFSLAPELSREPLLLFTYCAVVFSILVQGLTLPILSRRLMTSLQEKETL